MTTTSTEDRAVRSRESRLRKLAQRHGLRIQKSRVRNTDLPVWGTYGIIDVQRNVMVASEQWANGYGLSLDDVEAFLDER